jgi:hypothetical protein
MDIGSELSSFMCVSKEVAQDGQRRPQDLNRYVPSVLDNLSKLVRRLQHSSFVKTHAKHHSRGEDNSKGYQLDDDVDP